MDFAARFAAVRARTGPAVWGLDPAGELLSSWGLGDDADGLERFVDVVVPVATASIGIVKPQAAFYERHGWRGIRALARLCAAARAAGLLVLLDAKRGDVGSTNDAYATAYLGEGAAIPVDALTVHPYLGLGAMDAFVARAHSSGGCLLVVTRSSNPPGRSVQAGVEASLLADIGRLNRALAPDGLGPVGAVVAPTTFGSPLDLVGARGVFLAPGVGAQGHTLDDVADVFASCPDRVMPSASRALLAAGPDPSALAAQVADFAGSAARLLG